MSAISLKLPDGSFYAYTGTVEFSQVIVDQSTGSVTIRARFANPQSILLPGMEAPAARPLMASSNAFAR